MRRSGKLWFYRTLPMLAAGVLGVMLLVPGDGKSQTADVAAAATAPKPAIRLASAVAAPNATPASFKLASHEVANTGAPALGVAPATQAVVVSPPWPRLNAATAGSALSPGKVGNVAVNMRAGPSSSADKLLVLLPGEAVELGETNGGWTHVERSDGQSGWVYSRLLATQGGENPAPAAAAATIAKVQRAEPAATPDPALSDDLVGRYARLQGPTPVRSAPTSYAAAIVVLDSGERVRISQTRGRWLRIVTSDGISGWIPT